MNVQHLALGWNVLSRLSEYADLASLLPSSLPSSLSHLLQQCTAGNLNVLEPVMEIVGTLVENGEYNRHLPTPCNTYMSYVHVMHLWLKLNPHLLLDGWKVALVEAGCADHLLAVRDPELHRKATDILVLLLSEGRYKNGVYCRNSLMVSTTITTLEHLVNCTVHEVLIVRLVRFTLMAVVSGAPLKGNPELRTLSYSGHFLGWRCLELDRFHCMHFHMQVKWSSHWLIFWLGKSVYCVLCGLGVRLSFYKSE